MTSTTPCTTDHHHHQSNPRPPRCEWDFALSTTVSSSLTPNLSSDVLGAVELDPTARLLATGGLSRKIRIYSLSSTTPSLDSFLCTPAKLSSLRWLPPTNSPATTIASADYDGVITEYDLTRKLPVSERDEHGGRRIWSLDYSPFNHLASSGSDDGTAQVWDTRQPTNTVNVFATAYNSPVCSVNFEKTEGVYIGLGSADKCAYLYDLRNMSTPVSVFSGHRKTVTYVKFAGKDRVVTSSVDGCHRLWNIVGGEEVRAYRGHSNARSFVGMGVCSGCGLIGSGSESNEVYVYDLRWGEPVWVEEFAENSDGGFVSAVCWREVSDDECALVAGGSNGVVKIFIGQRKPEFRILNENSFIHC